MNEFLIFDLQEFVTSPAGILIIVGILFLLVGIVLFLKEGKKKGNKTTNVGEESTTVSNEPTVSEETKVEEPVQETVTPEVSPVVENTAPAIESVVEATPIVVPTEGDGIKEVAVTPVEDTINFTEATPVAPEVTPVVEEVKTETLNTPVVETLETPTTTVYGGISPEVPKSEVLEEKPREIYGGANPLENTAPIPTVVAPEVTPVETQNNVSTLPAVEPVPVVAPVPEVTPVVAPTVEEPVQEAVTPVVEPVQEAVEEKKEEIEKLEF